MKRKIIHIDTEICNGCGVCIPNCPEGALQIIDGKARLLSDLFCDGLGACIGTCPLDAIHFEEREAQPYSEAVVMGNIVKGGANVIKAHLQHLQAHNERKYLQEALNYLNEKGILVPVYQSPYEQHAGCPGSGSRVMQTKEAATGILVGDDLPSALSHWPVQMHLINPDAEYFQDAEFLLAADCTAFSLGAFHQKYLAGKKLGIACPKLDQNQDVYLDKLVHLIEHSKIKSLTVMVMEVPCCGGLLHLAKQALRQSTRKVPLKLLVVGIEGGIIQESMVE